MFLNIKIRYWVRRQNVKTKICRWHILPPYDNYNIVFKVIKVLGKCYKMVERYLAN